MYNTVIVGSGLSSYFFLKGLKRINNDILLLDYENNEINQNYSYNNNLLKKVPPRINKNNINPIIAFFKKNNIKVKENCSITGYLNSGGVSNLWGFSCEFPQKEKINFLNKTNIDDISNAFEYLYKKYNFEGTTDYESTFYKQKKINNIFEAILKINDKNIKFYKNCSAINSVKCNKNNNNCWIDCKNKSTFIPKNLEKIKVNKKNLFLKTIKYNNKYYSLVCEDEKKNQVIIDTKKLVLACGTIATTKLIMEMTSFKEEIKILHNPMIFGCFLSKKKVNDNFNHWLSQIGSTNFSEKSVSRANYRSTNYIIKEKLFKNNILLNNIIIKYLYKIFEDKIFFTNLYLNNEFSNLYIKNEDGKYSIYSKNKFKDSIKKELKENLNNIYKILVEKKIILPLKLYQIPYIGHDNHFTGTIPINGIENKLSVNENCELKNYKNLFLVDGSVIPKNSCYFPTGLIISNAYRIGKNFESF